MSKKQPKRVKNNAFLPKKRKKYLFKIKKTLSERFLLKGSKNMAFKPDTLLLLCCQ
jgi:hypothetical protein